MHPRVFSAAQNGDIDAIEKLYKERPELLHEVTLENNNVLHIGAREGHFGFVEWILDHVKSPSRMCSARNSYWYTPLHEAAKCGCAHIVRILIPFSIFSPFDVVYYLRYTVKILFENNYEFEEAPLILACKYGHDDSARHLLEASTAVSLLRPNYQRCFEVAVCGGNLGIVKILLSERKLLGLTKRMLIIQDAQGATPLHRAVYRGYIDIVQEILNAPLSSYWRKWLMKKKDKYGNCAIHAAIVRGEDGIVDEMISLMPDCIELRGAHRKTLLHFAVAYDRFSLVQKLLSQRKDENIVREVSYDQDDSGNTAIHLAAKNAVDPQLLQYLLSFPGVDVNAVNNKGLSALNLAIQASSHNFSNEIIRILEEAGARASYTARCSEKAASEQEKEVKTNKSIDTDTLVASLVASVTFTAIFQVPGGIQNDMKSPYYGVARLALNPKFKIFLFCDTLAFFTSLTVVAAWLFRERLLKTNHKDKSLFMSASALYLGISIVCTAIAFVTAVYLVTMPHNLKVIEPAFKEAFVKDQGLMKNVIFESIIPVLVMYVIGHLCVLAYKKTRLKTFSEQKIVIFTLSLIYFGYLGYIVYLFVSVDNYKQYLSSSN